MATIEPRELTADGYDSATLTVENTGAKRPSIRIVENHPALEVGALTYRDGKWRSRLKAGVMPGRMQLQVDAPGYRPAFAEVVTVLDDSDLEGDGTPDFLRLDDARDQLAFRRWFTYLAEIQYLQPPETRPAEIVDCAGLIRYAYRQALHAHDSSWANSAGLLRIPAIESIEKYSYPFTPLGARLYRVNAGPFRPADLQNDSFLQFADARTLWRFNTHSVGRDMARALPGDILFFRQETDHITYHSMIYIGQSRLKPSRERFVIYHTGPTGTDPGEMRMLTVEELMRFPQAEWRPVSGNPSFLGIGRWNILRQERHE